MTNALTLSPAPMTVDEFLAWSGTVSGRFELWGGQVVAMSPERTRHAEAKFAVQSALVRAISATGVACRMLPDGMTVRIDERTAYEPDALVYCGPRNPGDATEVPNPVIVVEVLSPTTSGVDTGAKLAGYFQVASVQHYLLVDPDRRVLVHHRRGGEVIETRIIGDGVVALDPPGIELSLIDLFADL